MLVIQPPPTTLLVSQGTYHVDAETGSYREYDGTYDKEGEKVATVAFEKGVTMGKIYDIVLSFLKKDEGGVFSLGFDARDDGVRIVMRLYSVISGEGELAEELYESEGREIGVEDLEWRPVRQDRLDDEHKLSELFETWGSDLTKEKGGTREQDWWRKAHQARIREFMVQQSARGRGE